MEIIITYPLNSLIKILKSLIVRQSSSTKLREISFSWPESADPNSSYRSDACFSLPGFYMSIWIIFFSLFSSLNKIIINYVFTRNKIIWSHSWICSFKWKRWKWIHKWLFNINFIANFSLGFFSYWHPHTLLLYYPSCFCNSLVRLSIYAVLHTKWQKVPKNKNKFSSWKSERRSYKLYVYGSNFLFVFFLHLIDIMYT